MKGYDILKFIRSKASLKDLPVIILSAKDKELDKIMGLDLGADDYLTKPFSVLEVQILYMLIQQALHESLQCVYPNQYINRESESNAHPFYFF